MSGQPRGLMSDTTFGASQLGGSASRGSNADSNFVTLSGGASSSKDWQTNGSLVSKDKSPYAVTLHNVDKFDQLSEIRKIKSNVSGDNRDEIEPSEEYMNNLR